MDIPISLVFMAAVVESLWLLKEWRETEYLLWVLGAESMYAASKFGLNPATGSNNSADFGKARCEFFSASQTLRLQLVLCLRLAMRGIIDKNRHYRSLILV